MKVLCWVIVLVGALFIDRMLAYATRPDVQRYFQRGATSYLQNWAPGKTAIP